MILRDVTLASERQILGLQDSSGPGSTVSRATPERRAPQLEVVPPAPPPEPVLTVDAVCRWLEQQSDDARIACARVLAPDLAALKSAAQAEGQEQGKAHAIRELTAQANSSLSALARVAAAAETTFALEASELWESCTDIVVEVFLKLAGPLLSTREAALGCVLSVVQRVKDEREVTIRVSPIDLPLLQTHEAALREALGSRRWTLTADSKVSAGGCLVDSSLGTLDGRLEMQLGELCETLRAAKAARVEDP
jgi:flagellar assembly protein FliH